MPTSLHPQAKFDPIPPDLDLNGLVDRTPNLKWVQRVSRIQMQNLGQQEFEKVVLMHVILGGKPLVIDGWETILPNWLFSADWLEQTYDKKQENVRDIGSASDMPMTTGHYLRSTKTLTNQWTPKNFRDERRQRLYLKDIDCPIEWRDALQKVIHPSLFYLNENVSGESQTHNDDIFRSEAPAAPAGDLMSSFPMEMRAKNLMCYIGHEGTYTPAHREMCASLGQNIMVEASDGEASDEKPGSSIWFMTESKDREVVREYFLSMLGHDIEIEKHFAQINAWKKAPFDVYIVEQRPGDFILIPPLAAHQVWNRGTRTMKVAWNRTTPETLDLALHESLPNARLVCRDEQYKNKAMVYFTLSKYHRQLQDLEESAELTQVSFMGFGQGIVKNSPRARQLAKDFQKLLGLFTEILVDEMFAYKEKDVEFVEFDSCITCSYCRSNIFNRFLTCKHCVRSLINGDEDAYDICMECYAMGRSCVCLSGLQWCEQWSWTQLVDNYETWRAIVIQNDGFVDFENSPQPIEVARQRAGKKSVAQVCQEALRRRPWKDISKPDREKTPSDSEPDAGEERPRKKPKQRQKKGEVRRCHVCCHKDYSYRVHVCTNPGCVEAYCYGVLYRAFDMMPQKVLEDEQWQCPKCQGICNCGACRRSGQTNPYTPKNTSLGHDTRPIADDRSVEALVDFRIHNLSWLKAAGEYSRSRDSKRMQRLREQADNAKAQDTTEQEGAETTMHTNGDLHGSYGASTNGVHSNGYGDQSAVLNDQSSSMPGYPHHELEHSRTARMYESKNVAGPIDAPADDYDISLYPDPSAFARQRIGMGYYEQDDTPDKILFDPYQALSEEAMRTDITEPPEFVKKSNPAPKRKARRDNDNPDFVIGRTNHKKQRIVREPLSQPDHLDSMDPALFNQETSALEAIIAEPAAEDAPAQPPEVQMDDAEDERLQRLDAIKSHPAPRYSTNKPSLRHTKLQVSPTEVDDAKIEEYDEEDVVAQEPNLQKDTSKTNHLGLAADAIRAVFKKPAASQFATPKSTKDDANSSEKNHRRRGRPPKRLSTATQGEDTEFPTRTAESAVEPAAKQPEQSKPTRIRSGRAVRFSLANFVGTDGESDGDSTDERWAETPSLAKDPAEHKNTHPTRRGQPRRSGVTTIAAASVDQGEEEVGEASISHEDAQGEQVRRPRGLSRKLETVAKSVSPKDNTETDTRFMSMAERMALKGKKFKIGKRKPKGLESTKSSVVSTPKAAEEKGPRAGTLPDPEPESGPSLHPPDNEQGDEFDLTQADNESSTSSPRSPVRPASRPLTAPFGCTVVKLADAEEEKEFVSPEPSDSDDASSDDEDILARAHTTTPRGGSRGRGRKGRGRGRGKH